MATTLRTQWQTKQNYIWLAFGGACLFGALVFWAITDQETVVEVEKKAESEVELQIQPEKVATTAHLGSFLDEVKPLDMMTRVVAIAQHEAEFRGTKFIQENKKNSTVELFRVSEEAIIKRFLQRQSDRQAFSYLRLTGENQIEQYVLIYGVYKNTNEAQKALADLKLTLPKSVQPKVKKIEYTIDALKVGYDITKEQPQLFVTPTFQNLIDVLEQFESTMAYRVGGLESVTKAIECKNICTAVFSSGLQLSGVFSKVHADANHAIKYINTQGPSSLAFKDQLLVGHDVNYHAHGFGSPVGKLKDANKPLEDYSTADLLSAGIIVDHAIALAFNNGIVVEGKLVGQTYMEDKLVLLSFADCKVTDMEGNVFFEPAWGMFDMAIGATIVSVFNGSADKKIFEDQLYVSEQPTHQQNYTAKDLQYQSLFNQIRTYREEGKSDDTLHQIWQAIQNDFETDWLGTMELLELADTMPSEQALAKELRTFLNAQSFTYPAYTKLIKDGLKIIDTKLKFE